MTQRLIRDPELDLVAAASIGRPLARGDVAPGIDWTRVRQLAARHRVDGLVWHAVEQEGYAGVPATVADDLRDTILQHAFEHLDLLAETLRLTRLMEARGLPAIVLKGCPLAIELYGAQPQLRRSIDIDLLVAPEAFGLACALLEGAGYVRTTPVEGVPKAAESMARYLGNAYEFRHEGHGTKVELHHRLLSDPHVMALPFTELLARSRTIAIGNGGVRCLGERDLLVYLCCHAAGHAFFRLKWLSDIALWASRRAIDVAPLIAHAEACGGARHVRLAFRMVEDVSRGGIAVDGEMGHRDARIAALVPAVWRVIRRESGFDTEFRLADIADNVHDLAYEMRLATTWRSREYRLLTHLCNHRDLLTLERGVEWRWVYALLGRPLALSRFARRHWPSRSAAKKDGIA